MARLITRRKLLLGLAASATLAGCDGGGAAKAFLAGMERWNESVDRLLFSENRLAPEPPASELTPEADFPSYFISDSVPLAPDNWMLVVGGLVAQPSVFSLDQLMRMPRTGMRVRHHCVEGWSAVAEWHGVAIRELAKMVEASRDTQYVEFRSFDNGYYSTWDIESSLHPQTILAYGMNGKTLDPGHGAPLRLYSPVKLGYKCTKYLTRILFLPEKNGGYWSDQGYEWYGGV